VKGYRTIVLNLVALVAGLLGLHLTMDNVNMWLDLGAALFPVGNIVLRMFTNTAVGQKVSEDMASVGLHPDTIRDLATTIATAVANALLPPVTTSGAAPLEAPSVDFGAVAKALGSALESLSAVHTAITAAATPAIPPVAAPAAVSATATAAATA
jgi:hypothetical protein